MQKTLNKRSLNPSMLWKLFGGVLFPADCAGIALLGLVLGIGNETEGNAGCIGVALHPESESPVLRRHRGIVGAGGIADGDGRGLLRGDALARAAEILSGRLGLASHEGRRTCIEVVKDVAGLFQGGGVFLFIKHGPDRFLRLLVLASIVEGFRCGEVLCRGAAGGKRQRCGTYGNGECQTFHRVLAGCVPCARRAETGGKPKPSCGFVRGPGKA